ncbi:class III extradiol ring-cleavage dioxygenase family protein [Rhodococcus triatomae]|nr:hypothetical protein G419_01830 [Rhodococcus triatomae BKS 15-14]
MFTAAALVSCPPLLIPELAGTAAQETADLRAASVEAAGLLAASAGTWTIVGVGPVSASFGPDTVGSFAGFGVDVRVGLGVGDGDVVPDVDQDVPLPVLVGGWLRATAPGDVVAEALVVAADTAPEECTDIGARLRKQLDGEESAQGVLVVADGATTLTPKAPGAFDERAPQTQRELDRALDTGDLDHLRRLDPATCSDLGIEGRAAWQVLAGLFGRTPGRVTTTYRGAPFGVAYHVGLWLP